MVYKKWLALLCAVLLLVGLTGCSTAEIGYLNLVKEMNGLKVYESTGSLAIDLNQLPVGSGGEDARDLAVLQEMLGNLNLSYDIKTDVEKGIIDSTFYLTDRSTGEKEELFSMLGSGSTIYFKIDRLISFLKSFGDSQLNSQLDELFGSCVYLKIDGRELARELQQENAGQPLPPTLFDLSATRQQAAVFQQFCDGLQSVFSGYETGMVTAGNGRYTITIDQDAIQRNLEGFLTYSVNHIDEVAPLLKNLISGMQSQGMPVYSNSSSQLNPLVAIDLMAADVAANRDRYLAQIEELSQLASAGLAKVDNGSRISMTLEKQGSSTYCETLNCDLKLKDPDTSESMLDLSLNSFSIAKTIAPFSINVPTSGVVSLTDLVSRMSRTMEVATRENRYTLSQGLNQSNGSIEVHNIDGRIYLPLRQVADSFGEDVGWDPATCRAYVIRNGQAIEMTGIIIDDRTFVRVRDFEKLGYVIGWNQDTATATITRN